MGQENNSVTDPSRPIWHSPAWITAIVALIGSFLTVPDRISGFFEKEQEIERLRLSNIQAKQEQELKLVKETLAQQGAERVFLLRYLAETVNDDDAKRWAKTEVTRLKSNNPWRLQNNAKKS